MDIDVILTQMVEQNSSDLILKVGRPPLLRKNGDLHPSKFPIVSQNDMINLARQFMSQNQAKAFQSELELDFSYSIQNFARFRVNAFLQLGQIGMVFRNIPLDIPGLDQMELPAVFKDITQKRQGLILVTGATGSGKSTTLAAMIEYINLTRPVHIITIEDPVEFIYTDKLATVNQRHVGQDTLSITQALRRALRQNPDVILFGELRDAETAEIAVSAAETGHLVFSTLHTNDAKQSVDRLVDLLGAKEDRQQVLNLLSLVLEGIISQRLIKRSDGYGRIAACEIMIMSPHIRQLLLKDSIHEIEKAIAKSQSYYRMQTFNQALAALVVKKKITEEEALKCTANPDDLKLELRGITTGSVSSGNFDKVAPVSSSASINVPAPVVSQANLAPPMSSNFNAPKNIAPVPSSTNMMSPVSPPGVKKSETRSLKDRISKEGLAFYRDSGK
ncbi:MAG: PilT/PilU family type 4a pilus ATPase [Planctomycetota bacterium]